MRRILYLVLSGVILLLFACVEEQLYIEDIVANLDTDEPCFTYSLQMTISYPHYSGDDTTRATCTGDWEDGDVIYLFLGGENEAYANATYDKEHNQWTLHSEKMLEVSDEAECSVWYGKGVGENTNTDESIAYDYLTEAYSTESGQYSFQNGEIHVIAELKPFARRLRFKGEPGTTLKVQGKGNLTPYNKIAFVGSIGFELSDNKNWSLTINDDGYSDYLVFFADASTVKLTLLDPLTLCTYSRYFDQKTLKEGESGYFTVPTSDNHKGWNCGHEWQYDYVDLGLPSGTLWATCNVGAFAPEEYGYYYAWGETEPKDTYNWETYKWCNGTYNTLTKYNSYSDHGTVDFKTVLDMEDDAAHVNCGGLWCIPTLDDFKELYDNCSWSWTTLNGVKGYTVSVQNGNFIFLPAPKKENSINMGSFWTSSLYSNNNCNYDAYYFWIVSNSRSLDHSYRANGVAIRPVCRKIQN